MIDMHVIPFSKAPDIVYLIAVSLQYIDTTITLVKLGYISLFCCLSCQVNAILKWARQLGQS